MISSAIYAEWMEKTQKTKINQILLRINPKGKILDVGAGPGFLEEFLPEAVAVDVDQENLKRIQGEKYVADGNDLPFKKESFDTVFCLDTIHLIHNTKSMINVMKKDGILIVSSFCSKYNQKEKTEELKNKFKSLKLIDEFLVRAENEWDVVCVFKKSY